MFYDACDLFFTDYHWDEKKLAQSSKNAGQESLKVFTGIDMWGRGAYEGGQYNSYKGVKVRNHRFEGFISRNAKSITLPLLCSLQDIPIRISTDTKIERHLSEMMKRCG